MGCWLHISLPPVENVGSAVTLWAISERKVVGGNIRIHLIFKGADRKVYSDSADAFAEGGKPGGSGSVRHLGGDLVHLSMGQLKSPDNVVNVFLQSYFRNACLTHWLSTKKKRTTGLVPNQTLC